MAWRIDKVKLINFAVLRFKIQRHALRFNGNAAFFLNIHGVKNLCRHFPVAETSANLNKTIGKRRFTMIDVRDDGKISNMF